MVIDVSFIGRAHIYNHRIIYTEKFQKGTRRLQRHSDWAKMSGGSKTQRSGTIADTSKPIKYVGESYDDGRHELLASGELWEDPDFSAVDSSLFFKEPPENYTAYGIEWRRPSVSGTSIRSVGWYVRDTNNTLIYQRPAAARLVSSEPLQPIVPRGYVFFY